MRKIILIILIALAIFLLLYNLQYTSRFTWDESDVLIKTRNIYQNRKITLIGPSDEGGTEVFSSLPYYMFLPFCIIFGFEPIVPAYATVFYGILTLIIIALILKKTKWSYSIFILSIIFTPLLISSRWAWSPHFIPFWQALSLLIMLTNFRYRYILIGILMGLTIHQHWYAAFTAFSFFPIIFILEKKYRHLWEYLLGLFLTILPFILFDLTHPPGLFITRMLYFGGQYHHTSQISLLQNFWQYLTYFNTFISGNNLLFGYITLFITVLTLILYRSKNNVWILSPFIQIIGISLSNTRLSEHYILPAVIFYLFWLHKNKAFILVKILTILLIIFNLINLPTILTTIDETTNIQAQNKITNFISEQQLKDPEFNVVVLQSPDKTTKALRFKDQLTLKNIKIKDPAEYKKINTLYVISYQNDWQKLSKDPAYEIDQFRTQTPLDTIQIPQSQWIVYKLAKTNP